MGGIGQTELLIILGLALLLFGPSLLAFWLGYVVGQKKNERTGESGAVRTAENDRAASEPPPIAADEHAAASPEDSTHGGDADDRSAREGGFGE